jgi:branched-chain amino acid transport system ATP-binding protein
VRALEGVSITVLAGETVVLVGANGAGKSTTLRSISSLTPCTKGEILVEGQRSDGWPAHRLVQRGIIHVPEGRQVFPRMSVSENLDLGAYFCHDAHELRRRLDRVLQLFPVLDQRRNQPAGTLSGGEQQMLAIGRGLMAEPRLLMLDEPSLGLAPALVDSIIDVLVELNRQGTTLLLVEQNANVALSIADRGYVLETGRIVQEGAAADLLDDEDVQRAYLGY